MSGTRWSFPTNVYAYPWAIIKHILVSAQNFGFEILAEMPWIMVKASKNNHNRSHVDYVMLENSFVTCMGLLLPSSCKYFTVTSDKFKNEINESV